MNSGFDFRLGEGGGRFGDELDIMLVVEGGAEGSDSASSSSPKRFA